MNIKHIRIASDLHLEGMLGRNAETLVIDFLPRDQRDAESILVLAGDISSDPAQLVVFLHACQQQFPRVLFIPGNHEWYRHDYLAWNAEMADRFEEYCPGLVYAIGHVGYFELEDPKVRFIYGTLWGDGGPTLADQAQTGFCLNDFRLITNGYHPDHGGRLRFTVQDMMSEHKKQKAEIADYLDQSFGGRTVVVTHHMPSRRLVSKRFWPSDGSDGANGGFASNCDNLIATKEPWLWIHGHTHDTIDTELWKTRIVCHPAGYRGEWVSPYNSFMTSEKREDGTKRAIVNSKFVDL